MSSSPPNSDPPSEPSGVESTASLLERIRAGDAAARERLVRRYLPALRSWARGRLPLRARDLTDTDDVVQITLMRALDRIGEFEPRREGAFLAYLRSALMNQIRDQVRRVERRPRSEELTDGFRASDPSPLQQAIGAEMLEAYERALASLPERQQEAVVMRVELGFSYPEIAAATGSPTANAARMAVSRALLRLVEVMDGA